MTTQPTRLILIDDDTELCELLAQYLGSAGFHLVTTTDPESGAIRAVTGEFEAAILDVMLPGTDGFEVLRRIRTRSTIPVLMLTARGDDVDRIVGLELGADDYLPKPFNPRELVARLRAILRRSSPRAISAEQARPITVGDLEIDPASRTVLCAGRRVNLTGTEFELLDALMRSAGHVVARDSLSRSVLGRPLHPDDRSIDVHISNIRRKLGSHPSGMDRIRTHRGSGYLLARLGPDGASTADAAPGSSGAGSSGSSAGSGSPGTSGGAGPDMGASPAP